MEETSAQAGAADAPTSSVGGSGAPPPATLVLGVPLPTQPPAWARPPHEHNNPIDPLTGLAPSPPALPLPTLRGMLELSELTVRRFSI